MSKNDGGYAFPQLSMDSSQRDGHGDVIEPFASAVGGATLRQWYAGMALQGLIAARQTDPSMDGVKMSVTEAALYIADQMIAAEDIND